MDNGVYFGVRVVKMVFFLVCGNVIAHGYIGIC